MTRQQNLLSWSLMTWLLVLPSAHAGSGWIGNFSVNFTRADTGPLCDDTQKLDGSPIIFDNWARTRAVRTHLCFEVYARGITDRTELMPGELDVFVNAPHKLGARFVEKRGNNYLYLLNLRDFDPVLYGTSLSGNRERKLTFEVQCTGFTSEVTSVQVSFE